MHGLYFPVLRSKQIVTRLPISCLSSHGTSWFTFETLFHGHFRYAQRLKNDMAADMSSFGLSDRRYFDYHCRDIFNHIWVVVGDGWELGVDGWGTKVKSRKQERFQLWHEVAQAFQPADLGDFPVAVFGWMEHRTKMSRETADKNGFATLKMEV